MPRRPSTTAVAAPAAAEAADATAEGARPAVVYGALTAFWLFSNSKREEVKAAGDRALEVSEVMRMWRALSHGEQHVWEERERVEQKRYFNEVRARALWDESHGHGEEGEVLPRGERAVLSWGREASLPRPAQRGATAGLGWPFAHQRSRRAVQLPV